MAVYNTTGTITITDSSSTIIGSQPAGIIVPASLSNLVIQNSTLFDIPITSYLAATGKITSVLPAGTTLYLIRGANNQLTQTGVAASPQASTASAAATPKPPAGITVLTTTGSSGPATISGNTLNIPQYTSSPVSSTTMPKASDLGINISGDQTALLNTIFANPKYAGIIMDFSTPSVVTVNGTVNCGGKMIYFWSGSGFTGTGTFNQLVIAAGYRQKLFTIGISLTNAATAPEYFSAIWYGADDTGSADSAPAINQSINTVIANTLLQTTFVPGGTYTINSPLLMQNWNGTVYGQHSGNLIGEGKFWQGGSTGGTHVNLNYRNTFALGIQAGKGNVVEGIYFKGLFTPPSFTPYQFYTSTSAAFTDGVSRDQPGSPYAGIAIDPFGPSVPTDGGYPGFNASAPLNYYRGGTGGSTGLDIHNNIFTNLVIGIITSPNGVTANAELMNFTSNQFDDVKWCVVGCQAQEKLNKVSFSACWSNSYGFFNNGDYGSGTPGHWVIEGVNIAGQMNRLVQRHSGGYFPLHISEVYAEGLGVIGDWTSGVGDTLTKSTINFVTPDVFPAYPQYHMTGTGVTVKDSFLRYYGWFLPLVFQGAIFDGGAQDKLPYGASQIRNTGCFNGYINTDADITDHRINSCKYMAGGRGKIVDTDNYIQGKQISLQSTDFNSGALLYLDGLTRATSSVSVTSNVMTVTPPTAGDLNRAILQRLAIDTVTGNILGIITSVNTGAGTYTISYVPNGIASSSAYVIAIWCPVPYFSFMGDIVSGSNLIHNVVIDFGNFTDLVTYGGGFVKIPGFYGYRAYAQEAVITAYDSGSATFTMDRNAGAGETATGYYFSSNAALKNISTNSDGSGSGSTIAVAEILPKGSYFTDDVPNTGKRVYIVKTTGYFVNSPTAVLTQLNP